MKFSGILLSVCVILLPLLVDGKSNFCLFTRSRTRMRAVVNYINCGWTTCCVYVLRPYTEYYRTRECCQGWGGKYCDVALCNPTCKNSGFCVKPNDCYCGNIAAGSTCQIQSCANSANDCYPGTCNVIGGAASCTCHELYSGTNCLTLRQGPNIIACKATLKTTQGSKVTKMQTMDCSKEGRVSPGEDGDTTFMNPKDLGMVQVAWTSQQWDETDLPQKPDYVRATRRGVTNMYVQATLNTSTPTARRLTCPALVPPLSSTKPHLAPVCSVVFTMPITPVKDHDRLELNLTAFNGGFKEAHNSLQDRIDTVIFTGMKTVKPFTIIFDSTPPVHCSVTKNCFAFQPFLDTGMDIKKKGFNIGFFGWNDAISGIKQFDYQVFKLAPNPSTKMLKEEDTVLYSGTLTPDQMDQIPQNFTPSTAGMYSVILTVIDRAGNRAQGRTLCLYDPDSKITKDSATAKTLIIKSASAESGYEWITNVSKPTINVAWRDHFKNILYEQNKLLDAVEPFTRGLDDNSGNRTTAAIENIRGITEFSVAYGRDSSGGSTATRDTAFTVSPLSDTASFDRTLSDGDTVKVWVTAKDIIGNEVTDSVVAHVDMTPPWFGVNATKVEGNVFTSDVPFGTKLSIHVEDEQSGISGINITVSLMDGSSRQILESRYQEIVPLASETRTSCRTSGKCVCSRITGTCYPKFPAAYVNHCWFRDQESRLATSKFEAELVAFNGAKLTSTQKIPLNIGTKLSGLGVYPPLQTEHVQVLNQTHNTATIGWTYPLACYKINGVSIKYKDANDIEITSDFTQPSGRILNLKPEASILLSMTIRYESEGGDRHSQPPLQFRFFTPPDPNAAPVMSAGAAAGLSIGLLLLLLIPLIIVLLIIWRKRQGKDPLPQVVRRMPCPCFAGGFAAKRAGPVSMATGYTNNEYVHHNGARQSFDDDDDDVYIYGNMEFDENSAWHVSPNRVTYLGDLTTGRFAVIKMATLRDKNDESSVVAKMLKGGASEQDELLMKAKLNFYATALPRCQYLVNFLGAVVEGPHAPVILLEFCEGGNLREWAAEQDKAKEDTVEQMIQFAVHIAKGLRHLHSNKVVHRRLAARNVLLKHEGGEWLAKIHGFGPMKGEAEGAETTSKKERIPLKWLAPETIEVADGQKRKYDTKTDSWAYGITIWEMFSLGEAPFADVKGGQLADELKRGYRLPAPELCPTEIYNGIMMKCWEQRPNRRPSSEEIVASLEKLYQNTPGDDYYYG